MRRMLLLIFLLTPSFAWAQAWPNLPGGASIFTTNPMNNSCNGVAGWSCAYPSGGPIVQDSASGSGSTPPNSVEYTRTHNLVNQGGNYSEMAYEFGGGGLSSIYIGMWWKMSFPFYGMPICQNKLTLIWNDIGPGSPGKFYDAMFDPVQGGACQNPSDGRWRFKGGTNYPQFQVDAYLGDTFYGNGLTIQSGQWHRLEVCHVRSTTPTSGDGLYKVWLDGKVAVDYKRMNHPGNFSRWQLNPVWDNITGGSPGSPPGSTEFHRFDTVVLATGHTTCGTGTGGDQSDQPPGPPAAPRITNVTVQ